MGYKSPYNKVGKVMPEMKNQSKSSIMMNDASPLEAHGPGGSHPNTIAALERAKAKAAQLQAQKTADSLSYAKEVEKQFRSERGQLNAAGERRLMEDVKKRASEDYDFDIIQPTEQFPQTGVSVKKGTYLGGGYVTASGKEAGFGDGMSVSGLAKDKPRSGFEQTKARNISKLLGLK